MNTRPNQRKYWPESSPGFRSVSRGIKPIRDSHIYLAVVPGIMTADWNEVNKTRTKTSFILSSSPRGERFTQGVPAVKALGIKRQQMA